MTVRKIILYKKNPSRLRKKCEPVRKVNKSIKRLITDLKDTLKAHSDGIGLAAPQINKHYRVVIVRLAVAANADIMSNQPIAMINPTIIETRNEKKDFDGCLSFPDLYAETIRPHYLRITGWDESGKHFDQIYQDFDAVVIHHEIDHLDGVLFIDRVEKPEDFYTIRKGENGELVRVPVSVHIDSMNAVLDIEDIDSASRKR